MNVSTQKKHHNKMFSIILWLKLFFVLGVLRKETFKMNEENLSLGNVCEKDFEVNRK